jgi:hypothetical protein
MMRPRVKEIDWNGAQHKVVVHDFVTFDPAARVTNAKLKVEIDHLNTIAQLAKDKAIELLWHGETSNEFSGIWMVPSGGRPELLKAGVTWVPSPIKYSRLLHSVLPDERSPGDVQIDFIRGIDHPRFSQLQKACGAAQGKTVNSNQLLDAFHVWCAESAGATHFLTTDFKLVRLVRGHKSHPPEVKLVLPSELLDEIGARGK